MRNRKNDLTDRGILISIITPSYNQCRFIERTILSVLRDAPDGLEYVIFDGGSTDGTVDILKRYSDKVRWVSEPDRGQTHAVNKGIQATTGEIIGWLNSDDIYYPGTIPLILQYFSQHPEIDLVYGDANHIDEDDNIIEPYPTQPWNVENLKRVCFLSQPAVFFRRRTIQKYGLLDENLKYCMDYEYWLRLGLNGANVEYLPKILAGSRMYKDNKTLGSRISVHKEINDMMLRTLHRVPDSWLYAYSHAVLDDKGLSRSYRLRFSVAVSLLSLYSAIRWNKRVSKEMIDMAIKWIRGNFHMTIKEWFSR